MWIDEELSHWTILLHRGYSHRTCVYGHVIELCYWPTSPRSIFQQDGVPPHYHRQVRDLLNANFPDMWIGRGGHLVWPHRSPNLTLLDFFWGFVKHVVYQGDRSTTLEELRGHITNAAAHVTPQMLQKNWREVEYRLHVCRATQGVHKSVSFYLKLCRSLT